MNYTIHTLYYFDNTMLIEVDFLINKNVRAFLQEQFAQKVGVAFPSVNSWENGIRKAHPFLLKRLLEMPEEVGSKNFDSVS